MKKFNRVFVLIFIWYSIPFIKAQQKEFSDIEVKYYMKLVQDSLKKDNFITAEMVLLCNKDKSYYFNPEMVKFYEKLDHQINTFSNIQDMAKNYIPIPKVRQSAWKDESATIVTTPLGKYNYSYKCDEIKWELLPDIKKIDKFNCHLAKAKVDENIIYAWYTGEIPFSDGPFKFKGLPGLILEVYNENHSIEISATSVATKKVEINKMNEALNVNLKNRNEFLMTRERYFKYPFDNNFPKEIVQKKLEQLKKINVFLD